MGFGRGRGHAGRRLSIRGQGGGTPSSTQPCGAPGRPRSVTSPDPSSDEPTSDTLELVRLPVQGAMALDVGSPEGTLTVELPRGRALVIGSSRGADVRVQDPAVSARHCEVRVEARGVEVDASDEALDLHPTYEAAYPARALARSVLARFDRGTQAVALGKLAGGCRVQTYYPITPAADESEYLEENQVLEKGSIIVMQTEDEIAAVTMAT